MADADALAALRDELESAARQSLASTPSIAAAGRGRLARALDALDAALAAQAAPPAERAGWRNEPPEAWDQAALAAQAAPPAATCCDLACYEDPGCACDGCRPEPDAAWRAAGGGAMSAPQTATGRRLHRMLFGDWDAADGPKRMHEDDIAAVEREARAAALAEARAAVEGLPENRWSGYEEDIIDRAAVLSILDRLAKP